MKCRECKYFSIGRWGVGYCLILGRYVVANSETTAKNCGQFIKNGRKENGRSRMEKI